MTYEDNIEAFWMRAVALRLDSTQIAVGMALLHLWRRAGFPARCVIQNAELINLLNVSKPTLCAARKRLIDNGLIYFEEGNARKQPVYMFGGAVPVPVPEEVPLPFEPVEPEPIEPVGMVQQIVEPPPEVPKPKRGRRMAENDGQLMMFSEKQLAQPKKGKAEPEAPTLAMVLMLFRKNGRPDEEAQRFYDYYNAQGWLTSSGQRIRNLDSMVNRWLTNGKDKKNDTANRQPSDAEVRRAAFEQSIRARLHAAYSEDGGSGSGSSAE